MAEIKRGIKIKQPENKVKEVEKMKARELIFKEIEKLPEPYLIEILDFIRFLEAKTSEQKMGLAIASETSLKKDWLTPEENEAWRDL